MTTTTYNMQQNVVKDLRQIRDQISNEIKDMSFDEERAYLDNLLHEEQQSSYNKTTSASEADTIQNQNQ